MFIGRFNGRTFSASSERAQPVDLGEDYFASASWSNLPAGGPGVITLGWMDNWLYAQSAPTAHLGAARWHSRVRSRCIARARRIV